MHLKVEANRLPEGIIVIAANTLTTWHCEVSAEFVPNKCHNWLPIFVIHPALRVLSSRMIPNDEV
jgi:hypothetical protein